MTMPMKKWSIISTALFVVTLATSVMEGQTMNDTFLRSAVLVTFEVSPGKESSGTGFFLSRPISQDLGHVFLVTNKHVLPPEGFPKSIKIRVVVGTANGAAVRFVEIPVVGKDGKYLQSVRLHATANYDVAAVNITESIIKQGIQCAWLPIDLLSTPQRLKDEGITVGDEIFLLGYPSGIFDARNVSPILRTGVIATVFLEGYSFNDSLKKQYRLPDRIDGFLIDANVFPGSSGSVVILKPQSTTLGSDGNTVISFAKRRPYVLGIVSGSIPISDTVLGSTQRMGLGIVYSAEAIRAVINQFPK